jgi:hypothetical protein
MTKRPKHLAEFDSEDMITIKCKQQEYKLFVDELESIITSKHPSYPNCLLPSFFSFDPIKMIRRTIEKEIFLLDQNYRGNFLIKGICNDIDDIEKLRHSSNENAHPLPETLHFIQQC